MQKLARLVGNPEHVLSYALGFVAAWFGVSEVLSPQDWVTFAPPFLGTGTVALGLVILHGIILVSCALLLFFAVKRRIAAGVLTLIFLEVVVGLITQTGLSDIAVRDIGLGGMSLGLAFLAGNPAPHRQ